MPTILAGVFVLCASTDGGTFQDATLRTADSLIAVKRPWRATVLLAPRLSAPASAAAEYRITGARAAAAWSGWPEVLRILAGASWLDTQFNGEGRALLAEAMLESGANAVSDARMALAASSSGDRSRREVLLARAFDRANMRDSAARHYTSAAGLAPVVKDWLLLRAAGVTDDSIRRAAQFHEVREPVARARIGTTDAIARERSRDFTGASAAYRRAGTEPAALRVDVILATDSAAKRMLAQKILRYLSASHPLGDLRAAIPLLDSLARLSATEELVVARAAASAGANARATRGFSRSAALLPRDRYTYASVLTKLGRTQEALTQYSAIVDSQLAPLAAYQHARLTAQNGGAQARDALLAVAKDFAGRADAAAPALLLLADLQVDNGDHAAAIETLRSLASRYPTSPQAPLALFRTGILEFTGNAARAASAFDTLLSRYPKDSEASAARYWSARAYEALAKHPLAEQRWRQIVTEAPLTYYATLARRRLHEAPWKPAASIDTASGAVRNSAVARAILLHELGLDAEAVFEREAIAQRSTAAVIDADAVVTDLLQAGDNTRALSIAIGAVDAGKSSPRLLAATFPLAQQDALMDESRRNGLDPYLVAGLIRQESGWNPRAQSAAGAFGLMQLLPRVAAAIAAGRRYPLWNQALLYQPDVSIELGTAHLASSMSASTPVEQTLAAYNAGQSRVTRWLKRPGAAADPELFVELIPYTETRDYVRVVSRNAAIYRALYAR